MASFRYSDINFNDPKPIVNETKTILGLVITFLLLSWICVVLRLWVRLRVVRAAGWDDVFVGLYLITTTIGCIALCISTQYGLGEHFLLLEPIVMGTYLLLFYICNATYVCSTAFIKLALLLQYARVFDAKHTAVRRANAALIAVTALWGVAYGVIAWVPCAPVAKFWHGDTMDGRCWGYGSYYPGPFVATFQSHAGVNMALDVLVMLLPLHVVVAGGRGGSMPDAASRLRILALVVMAAIVVLLATWRLISVQDHMAATWPTRDPTWYGPLSIVLAALEVNCASMCASVPIFWPLVEDRWGRIFVTQEVQITRETRYYGTDEEGMPWGVGGGGAGGSGGLSSSSPSPWPHSRSHSDGDLSSPSPGPAEHYKDAYVMNQVDPLRAERVEKEAMESLAAVQAPAHDGRRWMRL